MGDSDVMLSVVVRVVSGDIALHRCLLALVSQTEGRQAEIIVPVDATFRDADEFRRQFPSVRFLDLGTIQTDSQPGTSAATHELYDRRTSAGLCAARGQILGIIEDYGAPDANWCAEVLSAHKLPHGAIGGAVENAGQGLLNWASYYVDFGRYQLPLREGPARYLTDANVTYKRSAIESVRHLWGERYNEATVHWALRRQGVTLWRRPQLVVRQDRGRMSLSSLLRQRFSWGRLFGYVRSREMSSLARLSYVVLSPGIPLVVLGRMTAKIMLGRRHRGTFLASAPLVVAITCFWWLGEITGYVTGRQ